VNVTDTRALAPVLPRRSSWRRALPWIGVLGPFAVLLGVGVAVWGDGQLLPHPALSTQGAGPAVPPVLILTTPDPATSPPSAGVVVTAVAPRPVVLVLPHLPGVATTAPTRTAAAAPSSVLAGVVSAARHSAAATSSAAPTSTTTSAASTTTATPPPSPTNTSDPTPHP
jgi:hypothetical protein